VCILYVSQSHEYPSAYHNGAWIVHWECLVAGTDMAHETDSVLSQLPLIGAFKSAPYISSSRQSSTLVSMLVPPVTFLRSFLFLRYCCPCGTTILYERGPDWLILVTLAGFHLPCPETMKGQMFKHASPEWGVECAKFGTWFV